MHVAAEIEDSTRLEHCHSCQATSQRCCFSFNVTQSLKDETNDKVELAAGCRFRAPARALVEARAISVTPPTGFARDVIPLERSIHHKI